ncbi:NADH dehydrogenase [ubiquinone] 1 beta subcomplex subunit 7 [Cylas formicarius]|uniref:NADH dehydrogenase [ubiquinone] 1 beta subcomplex subunit 7 n=1 Tax=Cylas formicarius TaxID=197179 RepID=UPI0029583E8B|nr:NADH dehydrogenase [ubiquinone] 1 beta subcomplex subunit 7 [Cylas formicarius]
MGNSWGNIPRTGFDLYFHPEVTPGPLDEPTFDPSLGFPEGRKKREMVATEEEMRSVKLPLDRRDYCAHHLIKYVSCVRDKWPFAVMCSHEKHVYLTCENEDFVLRTKEYERERRLRVRAQKIKELESKDLLAQA